MTETLQLATPKIDGRQLRVVFSRESDRWSHEIQIVDEDSPRAAMISSEGGPQDDWPASAPLQELSMHDLGSTHAILGVGMAGCGHWSISCNVEGDALKFDFACLVKDPKRLESLTASQIGSAYETFHWDDFRIVVTPLHCDQQPMTWKTGQTIIEPEEMEPGQLRLAPLMMSTSTKVAVRWAYQFSLNDECS